MKKPTREKLWRSASFGLVYFGLGVGSAVISNDLESASVQASIRIGILVVAIAVVCLHVRVELTWSAQNLRASALVVSGAVAIGTFLLAAYAVGAAWLESSVLPKSLLLALFIWPLVTGIPAFVGGLVVGGLMVRFGTRSKNS